MTYMSCINLQKGQKHKRFRVNDIKAYTRKRDNNAKEQKTEHLTQQRKKSQIFKILFTISTKQKTKNANKFYSK